MFISHDQSAVCHLYEGVGVMKQGWFAEVLSV